MQRTRYYGKLGAWAPSGLLQRWLRAPGKFFATRNKTPLLKALNPFRFGRSVLSLRRFYLAANFADLGLENFDVVHCQFGPYGVVAAQLKQLGIVKGRVLTSFHGYDMSQHLKKVGENVYQTLFQIGDGFLPISDYWRERLISMGCPRDKITVQRMGINTDMYQFQQKPQSGAPIKLLSVGRLVEKKGIEFALRALAQVKPDCPDFLYYVAGNGPLMSNLEALTSELGLSNQVKFLGWQSQAQIVDLMRESDIMITPSVTARDGDKEGIPMVLMEAMASGLPVISTYHSGIPELIEDGVSGLLVPERDVEGLAAALRRGLTQPETLAAYVVAGRHKVEQQFDLARLHSRLMDLYQRDPAVAQ